MKKQSYTKGFTLVETLIAIAILMVAIAGPLTVANQALTAALGARNTMIAYNLAQDGMESIKNIKDNNIGTNQPNFLNNLGSSASCSNSSLSNSCQTPVPWNLGTYISSGPLKCSNNCKLYIGSNGYTYDQSSGNTLTPFTRYYYISNDTTNDAVITVVVKWMDGSIPNEVRLQEIMSNVVR
jgi:prepilin-type N-terminal cleavage/methylation domain-containing protein